LGVDEKVIIDLTSIEVIKLTTNDLANQLNNVPTPILPRVIANMTQDEVRSVIPALDALNGAEVIGEAKQTTTPQTPES
jgi:hypothetical protein